MTRHIRVKSLAILLTVLALLIPLTALAQETPNGFLPWSTTGAGGASGASPYSLHSGVSIYGGEQPLSNGGYTLLADYVPFSESYVTLTMAVEPLDAGTTDPVDGVEHEVAQDEPVEIEAFAASNWKFSHWSVSPPDAADIGSAVDVAANSVTLSDDATVTAHFVPYPDDAVVRVEPPASPPLKLHSGVYQFTVSLAIDATYYSVEIEDPIHTLDFDVELPECLSYVASSGAITGVPYTFGDIGMVSGKLHVSMSTLPATPGVVDLTPIETGAVTFEVELNDTLEDCDNVGTHDYAIGFNPTDAICGRAIAVGDLWDADDIACPAQGAIYKVNYNQAPVLTTLQEPSVAENTEYSSVVNATDGDADDELTFSFATESPVCDGHDNDLFDEDALVNEGKLVRLTGFDYESLAPLHQVKACVEVSDGLETDVASFTIDVTNLPPTQPSFTGEASHPEGEAAYTASFSGSTDPAGGTVTYAWCADSGNIYDDEAFTLGADGSLAADDVWDYETKSSYTICVVAQDASGASSVARVVTIAVTNLPPSQPDFTGATSHPEGLPLYSASFSSTDPGDPVDESAVTYAWCADDANEYDDEAFSLNEDTGAIQALAEFEKSVKPSYTICVYATDGEEDSEETVVTINVTSLPPVFQSVIPAFVTETLSYAGQVIFEDPENQTVTYVMCGDDENGFSITSDGALTSSGPFDYEAMSSPFTIEVCVTAHDGSESKSHTFQIEVKNALDVAYGNCNISGTNPFDPVNVNATDLAATVLEIWDVDNSGNDWLMAPNPQFIGSPEGCNSNHITFTDEDEEVVNTEITVADVICTVLTIFDIDCEPAEDDEDLIAAAGGKATLAASVTAEGSAPISLDARGHDVAALGFTLELAPGVSFDATDADGDNLPDAILFHIDDGIERWARYDAARHVVQVVIADIALSGTPIDGMLATVQLSGDVTASDAIRLRSASVGNSGGADLPLDLKLGEVVVDDEDDGEQSGFSIFLPAISTGE